jgi:hypothetical protein
MAQTYKDLVGWQKSMQLVATIYRETARLPREEIYGLTSQLRRAAISIPCNIAEGQGRLTDGEFQTVLGLRTRFSARSRDVNSDSNRS